MVIPDINLLLYASDRGSLEYQRSREWWQATLRGTQQVGLCAPVVFGYLRLATNPRIAGAPMSVEDAFNIVENWMESPITQWLQPDQSHFSRVQAFLLEAGTGGNLVADAQIAAYAQQYNATVCSADVDFRRFPVKWHNPLAAK